MRDRKREGGDASKTNVSHVRSGLPILPPKCAGSDGPISGDDLGAHVLKTSLAAS